MKRLTYNEAGQFGVIGMNSFNKDEKLYACVKKLQEYEDTGLDPEDIVKLDCKRTSKIIDALEAAEVRLKQARNKILSLECIVRACDKLMRTNDVLRAENENLKSTLKAVHVLVDNMANYIIDECENRKEG